MDKDILNNSSKDWEEFNNYQQGEITGKKSVTICGIKIISVLTEEGIREMIKDMEENKKENQK